MKRLWCVMWCVTLGASADLNLDRFTQVLEVEAAVYNREGEDRMVKITQGTALSDMELGHHGVQPLVIKSVVVQNVAYLVANDATQKDREFWVVRVPAGETVHLILKCYYFTRDFDAPARGERLIPTGFQMTPQGIVSMGTQGEVWQKQKNPLDKFVLYNTDFPIGYGYGENEQKALENVAKNVAKSQWDQVLGHVIGRAELGSSGGNYFNVRTKAFGMVGGVSVVKVWPGLIKKVGRTYKVEAVLKVEIYVKDGIL